MADVTPGGKYMEDVGKSNAYSEFYCLRVDIYGKHIKNIEKSNAYNELFWLKIEIRWVKLMRIFMIFRDLQNLFETSSLIEFNIFKIPNIELSLLIPKHILKSFIGH